MVGIEGIRAYHVSGIPTTFIIDRHGRIAAADAAIGADDLLNIPKIVNRLVREN